MFCVLRCSCGGNEGWGNLFRLLVVRKYLIKNCNYKVVLIVRGNLKVKEYLNSKKIDFLFLKKNSSKKEISFLKKNRYFDISIIEMLNPKISLQKLYLKNSKKLIIFDDLLKEKYISDVLISAKNTNINPSKKKKTKFYSGYKYFPFNDTFEKHRNKSKKIKKRLTKITVFLGGSLYEKLLIKIAVKLSNLQNIKVKFIIGAELNKNFVTNIKNISSNFKIIKLPKNLSHILYESDLIISGGGYTKIESAYVCTPQISIAVHDHQLELLEEFKKKFNIIYLKKSELDLINEKIEKFTYKKRLHQHKIYKSYFKENGLKKLISKVL
jgi:spore coat polysaccharide biosynthesis predicted glycosyltransferase SpsG